MTTFAPPPKANEHAPSPQTARPEWYPFQVGGKHYMLQFWPVTRLEGYSDRQLAALRTSAVYEVSFRLETHVLPDGTVLAGYEVTGTGDAFQVLGGVANGIVDWAKARRPAYLYWRAQDARRQRLYARMIRYFAARGSGWRRLQANPFTGLLCGPEVFWLRRTLFRLQSTARPLLAFSSRRRNVKSVAGTL